MKTIVISGLNFHCGFSTLTVDVFRDGHFIDTFRAESQTLSFEELWRKCGRKATRQLRQMYSVLNVNIRKPSTIRL